MKQRVRPLTDQDRAIWARYASQIRALPGREVFELAPRPPAPASPHPLDAAPAAGLRLANAPRPPPLVTGLPPPGLDRATWHRFRSGKLAASRTIDLHGRTAQSAFNALDRFLHAAHADHLRCVEVITGRGSGEQGGVIRRELPMWLNLPSLRPLVLATAHPHAVNPGSTRILLRRPK